jgi:hypothetical protein
MIENLKIFGRILLLDFKQAVLSKNFLLSIVLVAFFYILGSLDSIVECIKYGSEITVFNMYDMATFSTFSLLVYVLCTLPYANSFSADYKSNYCRFVVKRSGKRVYACSKVIITALSGTLCLILGEMIYLVICSFLGPAIDDATLSELSNYTSTNAYTNITNSNMLLAGNYIGYFLLKTINRGLIGSFLSLIALGVSVKIQNYFVITASPLLIYYFIQNFTMNFLKLPDFLNIANIFNGNIAVIDSKYTFVYAVMFALTLSAFIGFFVARGIERKISDE